MNRNFITSETLMQSIKPRVSGFRDKEDDLSLFFDMRKLENQNIDFLLLQDSQKLNQSLAVDFENGSSGFFNVQSTLPVGRSRSDDLLSSEGGKNDYDWLLAPPGTPLFPSLEMESRRTYMSVAEAPQTRSTVLRSRLADSPTETTSKSSLVSRQSTGSAKQTALASGMRRPSSSGSLGFRPVTPGGFGSKPVTPIGLPTLPSKSRPSTPTSRSTLSSSKPTVNSSSKATSSVSSNRSTVPMTSTRSVVASRSTTLSRPTATSSAPSAGASRSSTPSRTPAGSSTPTRSSARSSTPTTKTSAPVSQPSSRASTPTRRPSMPLSGASATASLNRSLSSISNKSGSVPAKVPEPSRGASPTVKSRPWNPTEMPGFSLDAPPNLRTSLPDRPLSATRGRPAGSAAHCVSIEPACNGRLKRQSCSPSRGRASDGGIHSSGSSVPAVSRGHSKASDDVSPVVMGTKMVERVINMRKLAPPRQNIKLSPSLSGKSVSSTAGPGFGRTLSDKSLDMAIRHMDIRRTVPGNLRVSMTKIPASSMYSVRSGSTGNRTTSVSDSPLATSSNASSEVSVNGQGRESEDELISEKGCQASPIGVHVR